MILRRTLSVLSPADVITIGFLSSLNILGLVFAPRIPYWWMVIIVNLTLSMGIYWVARSSSRTRSKLLQGLHRWYLYPAVVFVYMEVDLMNRPIHSVDYDYLLITIDYWLFGVNPTQWVYQFAHPVITELLQVAYFSYYLLFIALGVEIYRTHDVDDFDRVGFLVVYGFFLSYLGYFTLPAVGPRFTLHDFGLMNQELPGLLLTEPLRAFVNSGGGIPAGAVDPVQYVHRDVFPSGHTQLSLVCVYLAYEYKLSSRYMMAVIVALLIVATVYLRYHYVIDLVAGGVFFGVTILTGHQIEQWWNGIKNNLGKKRDAKSRVVPNSGL
jgi:membrane-associated phospholipid phosphatase